MPQVNATAEMVSTCIRRELECCGSDAGSRLACRGIAIRAANELKIQDWAGFDRYQFLIDCGLDPDHAARLDIDV